MRSSIGTIESVISDKNESFARAVSTSMRTDRSRSSEASRSTTCAVRRAAWRPNWPGRARSASRRGSSSSARTSIAGGTGAATLLGAGNGDVLLAQGAQGQVLFAGAGNETLTGIGGTGADTFVVENDGIRVLSRHPNQLFQITGGTA